MSAHALLTELRRYSVTIKPDGDTLKLRAPSAPPPELLERVRQYKPELLRVLSSGTVIPSSRPVVSFRLPCMASNSWATAIGTPGDSRDDVIADLRERYGDRVQVQ